MLFFRCRSSAGHGAGQNLPSERLPLRLSGRVERTIAAGVAGTRAIAQAVALSIAVPPSVAAVLLTFALLAVFGLRAVGLPCRALFFGLRRTTVTTAIAARAGPVLRHHARRGYAQKRCHRTTNHNSRFHLLARLLFYRCCFLPDWRHPRRRSINNRPQQHEHLARCEITKYLGWNPPKMPQIGTRRSGEPLQPAAATW